MIIIKLYTTLQTLPSFLFFVLFLDECFEAGKQIGANLVSNRSI